MIAFGTAITKPELFRRCAEPGIRRAAEPGSEVLALPATGTIFRSYNALLDRAAAFEDLEALVLVHQDAEIVDADLCDKVRDALADPAVAAVGCVGAIGVRSIAWWEASVTLASFINRYEEHGGGDLHSFSWAWDDAPPYAHTGEVETLDGFLLVLSPWAVRTLRFDEALGEFHGYDLDFCLQVREAGRKVVTADFRAIHHRPLEMVPDPDRWIAAHVAVAEKWDGRMPGIGTARGQLARARAARGGRARPGARARLHRDLRAAGAGARGRTRARRDPRERLLAHHRPVPAPGPVAGLIAFGTPIVDPAAYMRYARPGIQAAAEPGAKVFAFEAVGSVCRSGNLLLDAAAARDDLEALVLVDEHVALDDAGPLRQGAGGAARPRRRGGRLDGRGRRADDRVVGGADQLRAGAARVRRARWRPAARPARGPTSTSRRAEVDAVDGRLMALSPWAVRNLRFDERLQLGIGYDVDYCLQARAAGRKVVTAGIRATHHHPLKLVRKEEVWVEGHIRMAEKWDGRFPGESARTSTGRRALAAPRRSGRSRARWRTPRRCARRPGAAARGRARRR